MDYRGIRTPGLDPYLTTMEEGAADGEADPVEQHEPPAEKRVKPYVLWAKSDL